MRAGGTLDLGSPASSHGSSGAGQDTQPVLSLAEAFPLYPERRAKAQVEVRA